MIRVPPDAQEKETLRTLANSSRSEWNFGHVTFRRHILVALRPRILGIIATQLVRLHGNIDLVEGLAFKLIAHITMGHQGCSRSTELELFRDMQDASIRGICAFKGHTTRDLFIS
jgi:hypothetical protein